jgi:hypothetical protein
MLEPVLGSWEGWSRVLVGVRVDGRDAGRRGAMNAYKADNGMIVTEMTVDEAVAMAQMMAGVLGISDEDLEATIKELEA